jgi:hypothetical protein
MKVEGTYQIPAPRERVWKILLDPEFLKLAIPGCEEMVEDGERQYRLVIKAGVGPIKGSFNGEVRLEDLRAPEHYRMVTAAKGTVGFVNGTGDVDLEAKDGATEVRYRGEVQVGGLLAAAGSRMVELAFRKSVNDFFTEVTNHAKA